jgi:hypothetical protein
MGEEISTWKPVLVEGNTYYMRNFRVYDNTSDYKVSPHNCRLTFVNATRVEPAVISGIPPTMFNFKDFADILSGKYKPDILIGTFKGYTHMFFFFFVPFVYTLTYTVVQSFNMFSTDAIGLVHEIRKVVPATTTRKANVAFTMKDLRYGILIYTKNIIIVPFHLCLTFSHPIIAFISTLSDSMVDCTLWDSLSVEFITHYTQRTTAGPVVVIIKHARIKDPQG